MLAPFDEIARLAHDEDNVAIATCDLSAGCQTEIFGNLITLSHNVLEGHRFAVRIIEQGEELLSWGMPFGKAIQRIRPGEYICNDGVLHALSSRNLPFDLPNESNFSDEITPFEFISSHYAPVKQVELRPVQHYFMGYDRGVNRGTGTRNYIILLGCTSRVAGFVRHLEKKCAPLLDAFRQVDGIVGVAHTEGDDASLNNRELVLRTLAGFCVHPNVGAVLLIDEGSAAIASANVIDYIKTQSYPINDVLWETLRVDGNVANSIDRGIEVIDKWLPAVNKSPKQKQPISKLKIALQCGGSDAFSGISGNPLAGWIAREVIRQGGSANLAETDELVGAEPYILKKVKSSDVAERFLDTISRFVNRAARHGSSAAGNPSGGNKYRGLYNIYLKSLGAAMKKHPDVRLDEVIEYGERMIQPGFYFMDSPGNDLESIAGQVAAGCNMIYFVTGNGSITNFPFVPTVKIVTTTRRFELLEEDMDVNAGAYLEGTSMDELGDKTIKLTLDIASGKQSVGEKAGHAQVQIWRNWRQPEDSSEIIDVGETKGESLLSGDPLSVSISEKPVSFSVEGFETARGPSFEKLGLILPTSLCAGQVARMAVELLNERDTWREFGVHRFVTLVHTEGCGASSGSSEEIFMRTMAGYLLHPNVHKALLLEHGCEKTHNDYFRNYLMNHQVDVRNLGWASIQMGGGIKKTIKDIELWFDEAPSVIAPQRLWGLDSVKLGILADPDVSESCLNLLRSLAQSVLVSGGSVIMRREDLHNTALGERLGVTHARETLAYAQQIVTQGLHIMKMPTHNWQEIVSGIGAAGANILIYFGNDATRPGHPFVPLLQFDSTAGNGDLNCVVKKDKPESPALKLIEETLSGTYKTHRMKLGNLDFQVTRGLYGISL